MAKETSKEQKELIELGRKLKNFYDMGYVSRKEALMFSFTKGLVSGVGAFIGGTLVIALILWILSLFSDAPLIGEIVKTIQSAVDK